MKTFSNTITCNSTLPDYLGVTFKLRLFSHGTRSRLRQALSPFIAEIRDKNFEIGRLVEESDLTKPADNELVTELDEKGEPKQAEAAFSKDQQRSIDIIGDIQREIEILTAVNVDLEYLEAGFVSIEGLEIEGCKKITAKALFEEGPEDLCKEIVAVIKERCAGIILEKRENLESPITSGAVADGQTSDTIAPSANVISITGPETAASISESK